MTILFSDNFNRADSGSLGSNWVDYFCTATIASNEVVITAGGSNPNPTECVNTGVGVNGVIGDAKATITLKTLTGSIIGGLTGRRPSGVDSYYVLKFFADGGWLLIRKNTGAYTTLATDGGTKLTLSNTSPARMEISGSGTTVTLNCYYNNSLLLTYSDSDASRLTAAGYWGFFGEDNNNHFDNWQIEDFAAGSTVVSKGYQSNFAVKRASYY